MGGICFFHILEAQMDSRLQRLDPPYLPMRNHRSIVNLVIRLQLLDLPKEKVNLTPPASLGVPTRLLHRGARSTKRKGRRKTPNYKPHRLPVDDLVTQFVGDIFSLPPLTKLQPGCLDYIYLRFVGMGFQMKKNIGTNQSGAQSPRKLRKDGRR